MKNIPKRLLEKLEKRKTLGNYRCLPAENDLIDFSSNDYLGLSNSQVLLGEINRDHMESTAAIGSTGSRLLTGNSPLHSQLEETLATYFQAPAALLFNSGYTANLALASTIPQRGDTVLYDQHIHACVKEGVRLSNSRYLTFNHNDPKDLERKLRNSNGNKYVVIESLYSMEGDYPPIEEFMHLCEKYQAALMVDEAHTTGWVGPGGRGWAVDQGIADRFLARVYTFGKAVGAYGACIVGSKELVHYLVNYSRPFIYTTALPPYNVLSIGSSLKYLDRSNTQSEKLRENINHYLELLKEFRVTGSSNPNSPIQWIRSTGNDRARKLSEHLATLGFDVRPILSPTVPIGTERLRICLHSFNTKDQINDLLSSIASK